MTKFLCVIIYVALMFLFPGCDNRSRSVQRQPQPSDTIYAENAVMRIYGSDPGRALTLIDSAVIVGNIKPFVADILRATVYSRSVHQNERDSAARLCETLLRHDSLTAKSNTAQNRRYRVMEILCNIYRGNRNYEQELYWCTELAVLQHEQGLETEVLRTKSEIGYILTHIGQTLEGLDLLDHNISQLDGRGSVDRMDAYIVATKRKINALNDLGRIDETIPLAMSIIEKIKDYQENPDEYAEDSFRLPPDKNLRAKYCNYYLAQAYMFLAQAYAETGRKKEALHYSKLYEQSECAQNLAGRKVMGWTWLQLGEYGKLDALCDELEQCMEEDTISNNYATILYLRASADEKRGRYAKACDYWHRYNTLQKVLNDSLHASNIYDYTVRYKIQEREIENERNKNRVMRWSLVALISLICAMLTIGLAIWLYYQKRVANRRNLALRCMIDELLDSVSGNIQDESVSDTDENNPEEEDKMSKLFLDIDHCIRERKLYADINLQRQDIISRFGISRNTLNHLLNTYAEGLSFPNYINNIRMEKACTLLRSKPEKTISEIASEVGLSQHNFHNLFRRYFGLTPLTYRIRYRKNLEQ